MFIVFVFCFVPVSLPDRVFCFIEKDFFWAIVKRKYFYEKQEMDNKKIAQLRENYNRATLSSEDLLPNPFDFFKKWLDKAIQAQVLEPNAMTLATATVDGFPSARIVLLKGIDEGGFLFYTNYESDKAKQLAENPRAALVFNWLELHRQVRIEGEVEKVSKAIAEAYFQSRPKGSQIGAYASPQSQVIPDRKVLEQNVEQLILKYKEQEALPIPKHWGGYRVKPHKIEFWQGRTSRLHDRFRYTLQADNLWRTERLAP